MEQMEITVMEPGCYLHQIHREHNGAEEVRWKLGYSDEDSITQQTAQDDDKASSAGAVVPLSVPMDDDETDDDAIPPSQPDDQDDKATDTVAVPPPGQTQPLPQPTTAPQRKRTRPSPPPQVSSLQGLHTPGTPNPKSDPHMRKPSNLSSTVKHTNPHPTLIIDPCV